MTDATKFLHNIMQTAEVADARTTPFIAFVVARDDIRSVTIFRIGEDVDSSFSARLLHPFALYPDDVVLAVPYGREVVVVGKFQSTDRIALPSGMDVINGGVLAGYVGDKVSQTWSIDAATGVATFGGAVSGAAATFTSLNAIIPFEAAQSSATSTSTSNTTTFQVGMTTTVTLPTGNWTIAAQGTCGFLHSANNRAHVCMEIDGVQGTATSASCPSGTPAYRRLAASHQESGVVGGTTVNVRLMYKSLDVGTTSANNPAIFGVARRTA